MIIPTLLSVEHLPGYRPGDPDSPILEEYSDELVVAYTVGPPFGQRLVSERDLEALEISLRALRRSAAANLAGLLGRVEIHGLPPVFTLSFEGAEASLLLSDDVWDSLADQVDGELVIGAPARDVLFLTGSESQAGIEKIHRACERIAFASNDNLLSRHLLIRRDRGWDRF
jgi:uncharacterized protein YtpQ (UPF0354 family)